MLAAAIAGLFGAPGLAQPARADEAGTFAWGFRASFRAYVGANGGPALCGAQLPLGERITVGDGATFDAAGTPAIPGQNETRPYIFPGASADVESTTDLTIGFAGSVVYHHPQHCFVITVANPKVVVTEVETTIVADVTVEVLPGFTSPAGTYPMPNATLAVVTNPTIVIDGDSVTVTGAGVQITQAGVDALQGFLSLGSELDNFVATATISAPEPVPHLEFTTQPSNANIGASIGTPAVTVKDADGNPITSYTDNVSIALTGGAPGAALTCTGGTTVAAVAGVATFTGCSVSTPSTGYTLRASSGTLDAADSTAFTIASLPATKLVFTTQPAATATVGGSIGTPAVTVQNASNGTVTDYAGNVTLALNGGSVTGRTLDCGPAGTTRPVVNGVATFDGCSITGGTSLTGLTAMSGTFSVNSTGIALTAPIPANDLTWKLSQQAWTASSLSPSRESGLPAVMDATNGWVFPVSGEPQYDPNTGVTTVSFAGSLAIGNVVQGGYRVILANPSIEVDADGHGQLLADVSYRLSGEPQTTPVRVVVVTFTLGSVSDTGGHVSWTVTPDAPLRAEPNPNGWRQFPQSFLDVLVPSLWGHFQQSGSASADPNKPPAPLTVSFDYTYVEEPTPIESVIPDGAADPDTPPVSVILEDGESVSLVSEGTDTLITATFNDPSGGTGKVLLAKYASDWPAPSAAGVVIQVGGAIYDVHFAATSSTGPNATLTVVFANGTLPASQALIAWDGDSWEPVRSQDAPSTPVVTTASGGATVTFGNASTPTLSALSGTEITAAPAQHVDVQLDQDSVEVTDTVNATVSVSTTGAGGVEVTVSYDPDVLEFVDIALTDTTAWMFAFCDDDDLPAQCLVSSAPGTLRFIALRMDNTEAVGENIPLATITFATREVTESTHVAVTAAKFSTFDGQELPLVTFGTGDSLQVVPIPPEFVTITGHVRLQGRAGHAGVTVRFGDVTGTTLANGYFSLTVPYNSQGILVALAPGYLRAVSVAFTANASIVVPDVQLRGGDANGDGQINIFDLALVAGSFEKSSDQWPSGSGSLEPAQAVTPDINGNNAVELFDLTLTAGNYGTPNPISWTLP